MPDTLTLVFWLVVAVYLWYAGSYFYREYQDYRIERYKRNEAHKRMEEL